MIIKSINIDDLPIWSFCARCNKEFQIKEMIGNPPEIYCSIWCKDQHELMKRFEPNIPEKEYKFWTEWAKEKKRVDRVLSEHELKSQTTLDNYKSSVNDVPVETEVSK